MSSFPAALPHGALDEVFDNVFFVTGTMEGEFFDAPWTFSRNMTVIREGDELTLVNSVRLDDAGLAALDALGKVVHVVRIGSLHGRDDAFYVERYGATYWAAAGMPGDGGPAVDRELVGGGEAPVAGCSVFQFHGSKLPEVILVLDREGGIAISCDALQNWVEPDGFFSAQTRETMTNMGFFQEANLGPVWVQVNEPQADDFVRLKDVSFKHALCGHGAPLRDRAQEAYAARFEQVFGI